MDLNTASIPVMAKLVGLESAHDLFLWRPFLSWADVARVPGFDADRVEDLRRSGAQVSLPDGPTPAREALDARLRSIDRGLDWEGGASST